MSLKVEFITPQYVLVSNSFILSTSSRIKDTFGQKFTQIKKYYNLNKLMIIITFFEHSSTIIIYT